ncbi:hypothetical protein DMENIID0001_162280 [Sergentomyia squamirostris]
MSESSQSKLPSVRDEVESGREVQKKAEITPLYPPATYEPCFVRKIIEKKVVTLPPPPPPPVCNHVTGVKILILREALSPKERLKLLAKPRKKISSPPVPPPNSPSLCTVIRTIPPCSMRIHQLAKPSRRKVLQTWQEHNDHMSRDRKSNFDRLINNGDITTIERLEGILREHLEYCKIIEKLPGSVEASLIV